MCVCVRIESVDFIIDLEVFVWNLLKDLAKLIFFDVCVCVVLVMFKRSLVKHIDELADIIAWLLSVVCLAVV